MEESKLLGISRNFGTCADSVYQALLSAYKREPGFEAIVDASFILVNV